MKVRKMFCMRSQDFPNRGRNRGRGTFASCGYDTVEALRKLAPRLKLVHLKDIQARGGEVNVLLGTGISKFRGDAGIRRQNFAGLVAVEYEKEGDVNDDLRREIEFARKIAWWPILLGLS